MVCRLSRWQHQDQGYHITSMSSNFHKTSNFKSNGQVEVKPIFILWLTNVWLHWRGKELSLDIRKIALRSLLGATISQDRHKDTFVSLVSNLYLLFPFSSQRKKKGKKVGLQWLTARCKYTIYWVEMTASWKQYS